MEAELALILLVRERAFVSILCSCGQRGMKIRQMRGEIGSSNQDLQLTLYSRKEVQFELCGSNQQRHQPRHQQHHTCTCDSTVCAYGWFSKAIISRMFRLQSLSRWTGTTGGRSLGHHTWLSISASAISPHSFSRKMATEAPAAVTAKVSTDSPKAPVKRGATPRR